MVVKHKPVIFEGSSGTAPPLQPVRSDQSDPLAESFVYPQDTSTRALVTYLLAQQRRRQYPEGVITDYLPYMALMRHMKGLRDTYASSTLYRAIKLAADRCKHPFSTKILTLYIQRVLEWQDSNEESG